jgi:iron complex transport system ATP-binding protein
MMDTLSGGERQEVFVAAALAQEARVLVLDEPTTFLDYRHQISISRILKEANRDRGVTVISVTHDVNAALDWSNRILALREGRTVYSGPSERLADVGVLEEIYGTAFWTAEHPGGGRPLVLPKGDA